MSMVAVRAVNNSVGRKNSGIGNMNGGSTSGRRNGGTGNGRNTNGGSTNGGSILTLLLPSLTPPLTLVAFHMLVNLRNGRQISGRRALGDPPQCFVSSARTSASAWLRRAGLQLLQA